MVCHHVSSPLSSLLLTPPSRQATPLVAGLSVAAAALAGREALLAYHAWAKLPRKLKYYEGGFQPAMDRREAALILGLRCVPRVQVRVRRSRPWVARERDTAERKVKEAHRRIMVANHPDGGGSDFLASKINEAKDLLLKAGKNSSNTTF